jgi:hypothetical protein
MGDMTPIIVPKSDQLNAEDFLAGPRSYTIEGVTVNAGAEQPVSVKLRGEPRVWRPCKSMSKVMVKAWGADSKGFIGRSVTLYNDPKVKWGGLEVGGIRISHMSHIERELVIALTATRGKRSQVIVRPLVRQPDRQFIPPAATEEAAVDDVSPISSADDGGALDGGFDMGEPSIATEAAEIEAKFRACQTVDALRQCKELTLADRKRIVAADGAYRAVFATVMQRELDRLTDDEVRA